MVKVWKSLDEIASSQVPQDYWEIEELMQSIPKHSKNEGARKVYQKREYAIYKVDNGFIIHNTKVEFEKAHTHLKSFNMAKVLIDSCIRKRLPRTRNRYLLSSLIRISVDRKFIEEVESLLEVRGNKEKNSYVIKR